MQINILGMKFKSLKINGSFAAAFSRARFHVQLTKQVTDVHIRSLPDSMHGSSSWQRELSPTFLKPNSTWYLKPLRERLFTDLH